jgi:alpha/beta superfamily hydrolase
MQKIESLLLPGPSGLLETVWNEAGIPINNEGTAALVCHPHPLFDGSMHNKVVSTLVKTFAELGIPSLKFNFRGVGSSQGTYSEALGETDDAESMFHWLKQEQGVKSVYLAGFSFGSYVAANLAHRLSPNDQACIKHLILVAPPVHNFDFTDLFPADYPTTVVVSDADEVVPPEEVYHWLESVYPPLEVLDMPGASHFFHGRLTELKRNLKSLLTV